MQDPAFFRSAGVEKGRDGCRVPLPWTAGGASLGFGGDHPHLPQPAWFSGRSGQAQDDDPASTLRLYRRVLGLRRKLQSGESLQWVDSADTVLHFRRPGGWESITNFDSEPVQLSAPAVISSSPLADKTVLPTDTTAWIMPS